VFLVGVGEDVGALQRLVKETEDVVDDENALLCVFGTGGVWGCISAENHRGESGERTCFQAIDCDVIALW
jgi:hypothetical protein